MKNLFTRLLVALLWLLHWLPLPVLRAIGGFIGRILYVLGRERREVALTNLRLCFPDLGETEREALARHHFIAFSQAFIDRTLGWWAPRWRLRRLIRLHGEENLRDPEGRPVILLAPHFVGLDAGGTMMTMTTPLVSVYSNQKNPVINQVLLNGRLRFNQPILMSRQDGMRKAIKALKDGYPFYYLPDMDFGPKESIFVPFFGVTAATITGVSRLARLTHARVVPCITRQVKDGYEVELQPAWENYPGDSVEADTERMNRYIETQVLRMPEQYFWLHKRFKTRPPGEQRYYK
ncbi:MAG TPA: lysophospholipid acyltransferase family protein [Rhodocyclaceae bacterium]|nr:lysophospholipid acyltransferase family protein [Rhodocyclaceae bacterium]